MPQPRQEPQLTDAPAVQEGSRWIGGRPTPDEFAKWFEKNVKIADGLDHANYIGGLVLISGNEKRKVARVAANGAMAFPEEERLVHTPYAKVETRIAYFWDLVAEHDDWVGIIEPGEVVGGGVKGLPPGFFRSAVQTDQGVVNFVCCSMRVRILRAGTVRTIGSPRMGTTPGRVVEGEPIAEYPAATKMIPSMSGSKPDAFALMKAETGAIGRALGMAGMLVIPGSGVATAEDMMELGAPAPVAAPGADPAAGEEAQVAAEQPDLRAEIATMLTQLEEEKPGKLEEIQAWARERRVTLSSLTDSQLRGVHRKCKEALEETDG